MSKKALVIVDLQNDYFPNGKWVLDGIEAASANAARLIAASREAGVPVVHVHHESGADAPFFNPGTEGAEINGSVKPADGEETVLKHAPNGFKDTKLEAILRRGDIEQLTICGAMSQMCIDATTRAAADLGFACTVIHDACAARATAFDGVDVPAQQVHAAFMASLGFGYAKVVSTDEYLADS